jgi:hypothetical protein
VFTCRGGTRWQLGPQLFAGEEVNKPRSCANSLDELGFEPGQSQESLDAGGHSLNSQSVYLEGLHNLQMEDFSVCHHLFIPFEKDGLAGMCSLIALQFGL